MDDVEFFRLYGVWAARGPRDVHRLFDGYPGVWWIAGGWALEAFTGAARPHGDIDPGILRSELPLLRAHLRGRLDIWTATSGALKPLRPDDGIDADADDALPPGCGQVWTRTGATAPWEHDILLGPGTRLEWRYRRDPSIRMPMAAALWERDGIRYLQPEIQLLYKAKGLRPKDEADFTATLPFLDEDRRSWLADALDRSIPGHPWLERLS